MQVRRRPPPQEPPFPLELVASILSGKELRDDGAEDGVVALDNTIDDSLTLDLNPHKIILFIVKFVM